MKQPPLIQLALDYVSMAPALSDAQLLHEEVEVLEIGTPLSKAEGMRAVSAIRELCPDNLILADIKSPDVGGLEAKIAFDAGADWMTVLGAAPLPTVKLALDEANRRPGKEMFIELTGIRDILGRAREWRSLGVERMVYHRGWDEGNTSRTWDPSDRATIQELINMGFQISVAGGLELETIAFFAGVDISVFIIGRAIREAPDPVAAARRFRALINQIWAGGGATPRPEDRAAKAVRYGISEMGLLLTVDGRECPGCDSPGRFCPTPRTEIAAPASVNSQDLVSRIAATLGPGSRSAVGWSQPGTFFLDVGQLARQDPGQVVELLAATGNALQTLGHPVDTQAGLTVAHNILHDAV